MDDPVYATSEAGWEDIDWAEPDLPEDVERAQAEIATELHCFHLSLFNMLGEIASNEPDVDMKRLATVLSSAHMRNVDAWGRFFNKRGLTTHISGEITEHLDDVGSDDVLCQLTGVALAGTLAGALHRNHDDDGTVFNQLLHREAQQGAKNLELCERYMHRWMDNLSQDERQKVATRIEKCINWLDQYVDKYSGILDTANIDGDAVAQEFRDNAGNFYHRIHPEREKTADTPEIKTTTR